MELEGLLGGLESTPQRGSAKLSGVNYLLRGVKPPDPPVKYSPDQHESWTIVQRTTTRSVSACTYNVTGGGQLSIVVGGLKRLDGHPLDGQQLAGAGASVVGQVMVIAREDVRRQSAVRQPQTQASTVDPASTQRRPLPSDFISTNRRRYEK